MKKIFLICVLLAFVPFAYAAKPSQSTFTSPDKAISVNSAHPEFTLRLQSNRTTGFSWFLRRYNSKLIKVVSQHYQAPQNNLAGAPGVSLWTFRLKPDAFKVPRMLTIAMLYAQPWALHEKQATNFAVVTEAREEDRT